MTGLISFNEETNTDALTFQPARFDPYATKICCRFSVNLHMPWVVCATIRREAACADTYLCVRVGVCVCVPIRRLRAYARLRVPARRDVKLVNAVRELMNCREQEKEPSDKRAAGAAGRGPRDGTRRDEQR